MDNTENALLLVAALTIACGIFALGAFICDWIDAKATRADYRKYLESDTSEMSPLARAAIEACEHEDAIAREKARMNRVYGKNDTRSFPINNPPAFLLHRVEETAETKRQREIMQVLHDFQRQGSAAYRPKAYRSKP